ncbi:MAG: helix-turn-helix transcriptional regulator [Ignavibacteriae bacterium]|nr:helix-turn-helix transcriptional regulator [Ignavibacteriota bacterium]
MNNSYIQNWEAMSDAAIIKEIGKRLKQIRLNQNLSQEKLSLLSGIDRITISRMESGRPVTSLTLIQVLRALNKLEILNAFRQEPEISPIKLLKLQEQQRKKASSKRSDN